MQQHHHPPPSDAFMYAAAVVHEHNMATEDQRVFEQIANAADQFLKHTPDRPELRALREEAADVKEAINRSLDFPPGFRAAAAARFLREATAPADVLAVERFMRACIMDVGPDEPEHVVLIPGPLQAAMHARAPLRNPLPPPLCCIGE